MANVYCAMCHALCSTHGTKDLATRFPQGCPFCFSNPANRPAMEQAKKEGKPAWSDKPYDPDLG